MKQSQGRVQDKWCHGGTVWSDFATIDNFCTQCTSLPDEATWGMADRVTDELTRKMKHAAKEYDSLKGMSKTNGAMKALSRVTSRQPTIPAHNVHRFWTKRLGERPIALQLYGRATRKHAAMEINSLKGMSKTNGAMEALSRVTARQSTIPAHNVHRFWTKRLGERPIALQLYGHAT
ncbi:hypothetical protein DEU56DRAFT_760640 [Suillus clintonianus]|uniref:uncharacterized protein n=1 Tax=Suillus clintonianus TaxID=1904413 RepID=UPI001B8665F3|nr:uncharacterized protein DEU56DRAFT_760640 [Suillus clintonianus]KAG2121467.1 hypothetical protein DEU56DRAFT_760640 [Suillus clintonianus]